MLTLDECNKALQLADDKLRVEAVLNLLPTIDRVEVVGPDDRAIFMSDASAGYGRYWLSPSARDAIRSILLADQRERLANIERQLKQLVVAP